MNGNRKDFQMPDNDRNNDTKDRRTVRYGLDLDAGFRFLTGNLSRAEQIVQENQDADTDAAR